VSCDRCETPLDGDEISAAEAFELTGAMLCDECADAAFMDAEDADDLRRANPFEPDYRSLTL
jgi:hypothetical protein